MTIENWIAVGAIAATLLAPIVKVLLEFALKKVGKNKTKRQLELIKRPRTNWRRVLNWVLFLIPSATLIFETSFAEPITRQTILVVSLSVASLLFMVVTEIFYQVFGILGRFALLHEKHANLSEKIIKTLDLKQNQRNERSDTSVTK